MYTNFDATNGVCELGCWLEPAAEGHGLVYTACERLLEWAFDVRAMHRAEWRCRVENTRSSRLAQRLEMTLDGTLRQSWPVDGVHYDKQVWAILAAEWRLNRATLGVHPSDGPPRGRGDRNG